MEKDFSKGLLKVNASGSWANLAYVDSNDYDKVKQACEVLSKAHLGRLRFKILDANGGVIEEYGPVNGERKWHEPSIRRN